MFVDGNKLEKGKNLHSDVCIVGGGAAGITLALLLSHNNLSVDLLESGWFEDRKDTRDLYKGDNVGLDYYPLHVARQRFLGGTTNHWGGWCRPLDPMDFERRSWVPYSGWPLSSEDLEPFYDATSGMLRLLGQGFDVDYWNEAFGKPFSISEESFATRIFRHSPPVRFGEDYHERLAGAENLRVILGANVHKIRLSESRETVNHVAIKTLKGNAFSSSAKQFVLASGGIENARILLASREQQEEGLGNQNDLVGRFFADHPSVFFGSYLVNSDIERFRRWGTRTMRVNGNANPRAVMTPALGFTQDYTKKNEMPNMGVLFKTEIKGKRPFPIITKRADDGLILRAFGTVEAYPNPDSRVMLAEDNDDLGVPRAKLDFRLDPDFWERSEAMVNNFMAMYSSAGFGRGKFDSIKRVDPDMHEYGFHHMGTTRMSDNPKRGVVDNDCRVHGIQNLYIAGSSVFPTFGVAQPTFTIVALAFRLSKKLVEDFD
jgi:choline dehydrogenase-like flavoprotein